MVDNIGAFYTGDDANVYGRANEQVNYANNSMKIFIFKCIFCGFSFAVSYAPNTSETGLAKQVNGQNWYCSNGNLG